MLATIQRRAATLSSIVEGTQEASMATHGEPAHPYTRGLPSPESNFTTSTSSLGLPVARTDPTASTHSALSLPLVTPVDEPINRIPIIPGSPEKPAAAYIGRFVEMINEDWSFRDEDEGIEIIALPRASTSSEGGSSASSGAGKTLASYVRLHRAKSPTISPSFSTSRLLSSLGKKSRSIWAGRPDKSGTVQLVAVSEVAHDRLPTISESISYKLTTMRDAVEEAKGMSTGNGPQASTMTSIGRRLSLRRYRR